MHLGYGMNLYEILEYSISELADWLGVEFMSFRACLARKIQKYHRTFKDSKDSMLRLHLFFEMTDNSLNYIAQGNIFHNKN